MQLDWQVKCSPRTQLLLTFVKTHIVHTEDYGSVPRAQMYNWCISIFTHLHTVLKCIFQNENKVHQANLWRLLIWFMITPLPRCWLWLGQCVSVHFSLPHSLPAVRFPAPLTDLTKPLHSHQPDPVTCMPPICWRRPAISSHLSHSTAESTAMCDEHKILCSCRRSYFAYIHILKKCHSVCCLLNKTCLVSPSIWTTEALVC